LNCTEDAWRHGKAGPDNICASVREHKEKSGGEIGEAREEIRGELGAGARNLGGRICKIKNFKANFG
jgi:hypothetical protein